MTLSPAAVLALATVAMRARMLRSRIASVPRALQQRRDGALRIRNGRGCANRKTTRVFLFSVIPAQAGIHLDLLRSANHGFPPARK